MRILIADDHALLRENLRDYLVRAITDLTVLEASDFDEVLTIVDNEERPDLILLDLVMPGMEELSGLRTMVDRFPDIPVAALSGVVEQETILEVLEIGARGFIPKTICGDALIDCLNLILKGEVYVPVSALQPSMSLKQKCAQVMEKNPNNDPGPAALTPREEEVLEALITGMPNKQIAHALGIKEVTVKVHLQHIYEKLGVRNRVEAVRAAMRQDGSRSAS